jgi:hypothetical protein
MGSDPVGAFRFICGAGPLKYDDPILFPGQPGRSHLHQFYGNTSVNAYSTFESLRTSGNGTCGSDGAGNTLNRSAYWIPAILDGRGSAVQPDYIVIYYKRLPDSDPNCHPETNPKAQGKCIALPNGLRFIAGSDMKGGYRQKNVRPATQYATPYRYSCDTPDGAQIAGTNPWALNLDELGTCPVGAMVAVTVQMPDCWDGQNLDSPDHGSHVDYQYNTGEGYFRCDDAHPYVIPGFMISVHYSVRTGDNVSLWKLSSDAMDTTKPRGWSLHADWFGAWDPTIMATWTANCINKHLSCTGGDLGNGTQMKGAAAPSYGWTNPQHLVPIPAGGMAM